MEKTREMYLRRNRKEKYNVLNPVLTAKRS